jgi:IS5 family transposase
MLQASFGFLAPGKRTRLEAYLALLDKALPWSAIQTLLARGGHAGMGYGARRGRPPFAQRSMARLYCLQQVLGLSDEQMEEALHDIPLYREFVGIDPGSRLPVRTTIYRFRKVLEESGVEKSLESLIAQAKAMQPPKGSPFNFAIQHATDVRTGDCAQVALNARGAHGR